jgi:methyl-accepting chemotaxis protein
VKYLVSDVAERNAPWSMRNHLPLGFRGRLPLGFQVLVAIGGLVALIAASVAVAVLLVLNVRDEQARLTEHDVPYAAAVADAALYAKGMANDERGFLMTGDQRFLDQIEGRVDGAEAAFARAEVAAVGEPQTVAVREARAGFERWVREVRGHIAMFEAGDRSEAVAASLGPGRALRKDYEASLAAADTLAAGAIRSGSDTVAASSSRSVLILVACLVVTLIAATLVAVWLVRTILRPVYTVLGILGPAESQPSHDRLA